MAEIRFLHGEADQLLVAAILQALATALLAVPLGFLYLATRYRRPEMTSRLRPLVVGAPLVFGGLFVVRQTLLNAEIADLIPDLNGLPKEQAEDLIDDRLGTTAIAVVAGVTFAAQLAVGAAVVLVANHARRAGLTSNFIGILGIIVGLLLVIPLFGSLPVVQLFWVGALGALFLGRWPGGRGPAWETGEPDPWPTAQQIREQREAEAEERGDSRREREEEPEDVEAELDEGEEAEPAGPAHPRSKKRKRKRRR